MRIHLLVFALFYLTTLTSAQAADVESAAKSRKWRILLHDGEIAPSAFFLSPEGHKSPLAELRATIEGLQKDPSLGCRYPARRRFLIEEMGLKIPAVKCERYESWRAIFSPQSLSLVFASSFFGNAASAFGHTFLRIDGALTNSDGPRTTLLDYGLNFSAQVPPGEGGIKFAVKGLAGGYRGEFSILPYIEKLQEYRDGEERDLWEYRLNLNSAQIERLLENLWELESARIPYYFLNKNCSYHLLALLEVASPDWRLTDTFNYWAIPSDTIRVLVQIPGAVTKVSYHPSLHRLLQSRLKNMSGTEQADFLRLRNEPSATVTTAESALVLDSLMDEQKFRYGLDSSLYPPAEKSRLKSLLQARARAPGKSHQIQLKDVEQLRVDQATGSRKISIAGGQSDDRNFRELELRAAYHDPLDADQGALNFSEISVLNLRLRQLPDENSNIHLEKLNLVRIVSLSPMDALQKRMSWMLDTGVATAPDEMAALADIGKTRYLQAGAGASTYLMREKENLLVFGFFKLNTEHSDNRDEKFRYGPSAQFGLWFKFFEKFRAGANIEHFSYRSFDHSEEETHFYVSELQMSWLFHRDWNLRAEQRRIDDSKNSEHRIALSRYF